ncbi:hypothetical protein CYMTET_50762 [Cymbomonas tetramitiformis]|uniref:Uncharacterized protein n=1 Tax=Cymbomonas tetramitiformis TaxID=36881 RepID=A0AAE0ET42_9CHLO|nr:hypothetical protein CYMTET_50762 [Cymbomonas tetramitiformis]
MSQLLTKLAWSPQNESTWTAVMRQNNKDLVDFLNNELRINGGHCKIEIVEKQGTKYPGKIPMNGPECQRFEDGWAQAVGKISNLPHAVVKALEDIGKKWKVCADYIRRGHYREDSVNSETGEFIEGDRAKAHRAFKEFVQAYATYTKGQGVTHYMHILYYHGDWITGGVGECPAIYTNQATEKSNSRDRRAVKSKTCKGKALTGPLADMVSSTGVVTWAPAILELLAWGARVMTYKLHDGHRNDLSDWWVIDIGELRLLTFAYDIDADTVWTEELLLKKLGLPSGKKVYITGRGDFEPKHGMDEETFDSRFRNMRIKVSKASKVAIDKMASKEGILEAEKKVGKRWIHLRNQETVQKERESKRQRKDDKTLEKTRADNLPSIKPST